jgi:predicted transporter
MRVFSPYFATRGWLKVGLLVAGAVAGAAFGVILTRLGKIVAGAPPATLANYAWNATVFGVLAGIVSPLVTWSALRRAPLWRTVTEPLIYAVAGGCVAVIVGAPALILVLPPVGLGLGFANLRRRFPESHALPELRPSSESSVPAE